MRIGELEALLWGDVDERELDYAELLV